MHVPCQIYEIKLMNVEVSAKFIFMEIGTFVTKIIDQFIYQLKIFELTIIMLLK